jgi:hypothetical protein
MKIFSDNDFMNQETRRIIGPIIWWTEGTKAYKKKNGNWVKNVDVTNTNPRIIVAFLDFLRYDVGVDEKRLRGQLQIHEGDSQDDIESFWSSITNIPREQFTKTILRPRGNKIGKSRGTCKVRYSDKLTYEKIEKRLRDVLSED